MDFQLEELQSVGVADVVRESVSIPRASPRTFALIALALVFPLSFAVLAHTLFTHPILLRLQRLATASASEWALLLLYQFAYLLVLFTFSLLSTAAVVFSVASLYAAKHLSFRSALSAVVPIFPRLFRTFLWVSLIMLLYNLAFALALLTLLLLFPAGGPAFALAAIPLALAFLAAHVYVSALWHLASVVAVLEPLCGLAAMRKSRDLLRGRVRMAVALVLAYLASCAVLGWAFRAGVVLGPDEPGSLGLGGAPRALLGGALVAILVLVNLVGLLIQSVFYYVCKSYHHQGIDRSALGDHLGEYLGEYVPLKSSIQMESI